MAACVESAWDQTDVLIMTAAVADMSPRHVSDHKLKKQDGLNAIEVQPTMDILSSTARWPGRQDKVVVGFAAETDALSASASTRLLRMM
jgi:phosphopantothenoylcysteine decarboxylase/phosphopantothenate--cysteine ligase